ncbi:MAG TPA: hypothetical protein VJ346_05195 [Bacteroidales bacterium]|nr:hypothetical protein [Bacteroidales bacterium]
MKISQANMNDVPGILELQRIAFIQEARLYETIGYRFVKYDHFHDGVEAVLMEKVIE